MYLVKTDKKRPKILVGKYLEKAKTLIEHRVSDNGNVTFPGMTLCPLYKNDSFNTNANITDVYLNHLSKLDETFTVFYHQWYV